MRQRNAEHGADHTFLYRLISRPDSSAESDGCEFRTHLTSRGNVGTSRQENCQARACHFGKRGCRLQASGDRVEAGCGCRQPGRGFRQRRRCEPGRQLGRSDGRRFRNSVSGGVSRERSACCGNSYYEFVGAGITPVVG